MIRMRRQWLPTLLLAWYALAPIGRASAQSDADDGPAGPDTVVTDPAGPDTVVTDPAEPADTEEPPARAPAPTPTTATTSVVVDERQRQLERRQREAEGMDVPSQDEMVVDAQAESDDGEETEQGYGHQGQVGLRAGVSVPYIFALRYGEGPRCDDEGEEFCRRVGPASLELEAGFGVTERIEVTALARIGLAEDEAPDQKPLAFGLGIRGYGAAAPMVKLYFGGRVMLDVTSSNDPSNPDWSSVDVGLRGEFGIQVDVVRYVGLYVQLGETLSFLRGLYFVTDGSGGVQVRFP